jgi:hypothetical protein
MCILRQFVIALTAATTLVMAADLAALYLGGTGPRPAAASQAALAGPCMLTP